MGRCANDFEAQPSYASIYIRENQLGYILSAELQMDENENELVDACRSLKELRTSLMHNRQDADKRESLDKMFSSGTELLLMFPANGFLAALNALQERFHKHKQFRKQRESALKQGADVDWTPPEALQRIDAIKPDGGCYRQLFAIELKRKDYMRRVIENVAQGIRFTVKDMDQRYGGNGTIAPIGEPGKPYDFTQKCDLQDFMLHVLDRDRSLPKYAQGKSRCRSLTSQCHFQLILKCTETQQSYMTACLKLFFH